MSDDSEPGSPDTNYIDGNAGTDAAAEEGGVEGDGTNPEADTVDGDGETDELQYHVDGDVVPAREAAVSVEDRGFQYGDAAFETLRAYGGDVFAWGTHAARLEETCEILSMDHGLSRANLHNRIRELLAANDLEDAYVRLSISRGVQPGKLEPQPDVDPTVVIVVKPLPRGGLGGEPIWDEPVTLRTVSTCRVPDAAVPARAKTHNYLNGILARIELRGTDADEAVLLDTSGHVAEGATSNVFGVDGDGLFTPALSGPVLPGITRETVLDIAAAEGIPTREVTIGPEALRSAEELFCTNSSWEVRPVDAVDDVGVGGGPVTELLAQRYRERIEESFY